MITNSCAPKKKADHYRTKETPQIAGLSIFKKISRNYFFSDFFIKIFKVAYPICNLVVFITHTKNHLTTICDLAMVNKIFF